MQILSISSSVKTKAVYGFNGNSSHVRFSAVNTDTQHEDETVTDFKKGTLSNKHQNWLMGFIVGAYASVATCFGGAILHQNYQREVFGEQAKLYTQIEDLLDTKTGSKKWQKTSHMARRLKLDIHKADILLKLLEHPVGEKAKTDRIIQSINNADLRNRFRLLSEASVAALGSNDQEVTHQYKTMKQAIKKQLNDNRHVYSRVPTALTKAINYLDTIKKSNIG